MATPLGGVGAIFYYPAGIAYYDAVARHIEVDVSIGRDKHIVTNRHIADHNGICPYPHSVAFRGDALTLTAVFPVQCALSRR